MTDDDATVHPRAMPRRPKPAPKRYAEGLNPDMPRTVLEIGQARRDESHRRARLVASRMTMIAALLESPSVDWRLAHELANEVSEAWRALCRCPWGAERARNMLVLEAIDLAVTLDRSSPTFTAIDMIETARRALSVEEPALAAEISTSVWWRAMRVWRRGPGAPRLAEGASQTQEDEEIDRELARNGKWATLHKLLRQTPLRPASADQLEEDWREWQRWGFNIPVFLRSVLGQGQTRGTDNKQHASAKASPSPGTSGPRGRSATRRRTR